jgi:hypothetical protein
MSQPAPSQCVGPLYRADSQKPTATVSTELAHENVHILPQTPQLIALLTYAGLIPDYPLLPHYPFQIPNPNPNPNPNSNSNITSNSQVNFSFRFKW